MDSDGSHILTGSAIIAVLILLRAFYSACEAAVTEISDAKVHSYENESGSKKLLFDLLSSPMRLHTAFSAARITGVILISYLSVYLYHVPLTGFFTGLFGVKLAAEAASFVTVILAAVLIISILGDNLPKNAAVNLLGDSFAVRCAPAVKLLMIFTAPVIALTDGITALLSKLFRISGNESGDSVTEEEIRFMVDAGNETGSIESSEREMINNVFEFHELTVSDVMTHRTDIIAVSTDTEINEVVYTAINSGFSRIPVYEGSIDNIEGILYVKDLLCLIGTQSSEGMTVRSFMRDAEYVPESCMCGDLFKKLTAEKLQLAVAVDEYGGTAGLVTMEDLVEAIVGNIQDEYDHETEDLTQISENTYTVKGTAAPSDVMDKLGLTLPEGSDYDTMSGFLTDLLGKIPEDGETPSCTYRNAVFTVLLAEDMRIERIKVVINQEPNREKESKNDNEEEA
ncbi:MAG: hemolysin family protein [Huintestinicola sp.]